MSNLLRLKRYLPLYSLAKQIMQNGLDEYDADFYMQLKLMNLPCLFVYMSGNLMAFLSDICCAYLINEIVCTILCFVILITMVHSHRSKNIKLNYWISVMICIRIIGGLIQHPGSFSASIEGHIMFCY